VNPGMGVTFFRFVFSVAISSVRNSAMLTSAENVVKLTILALAYVNLFGRINLKLQYELD
jgi:hypothetical protein